MIFVNNERKASLPLIAIPTNEPIPHKMVEKNESKTK